jgi:hypothetical protein
MTCVHRAGGMHTGRERSARFGTPGTGIRIGAGITGTGMATEHTEAMGTAINDTGINGTGIGTRNAGTGITGRHSRRLVTRL